MPIVHWEQQNSHSDVINHIARVPSKTKPWVGIAILAHRQGMNILTHQERLLGTSRLVATTLATEKALQLAHQSKWHAIEIRTDRIALI